MELRARIPAPLRRAGLLAALPALLVPAVAGTTTAQAKTHSPIVKRITPKHVFVGQMLTIHGRYFRRGLNKNTVAFKRNGAKAVFVKADKGTTKLLKVTLPKRLEKVLAVKNGTPTPTRLRIRVLAKKFGKRFSSKSKSPIVGPEKPPAPPKPATVDPNADCDADGVKNSVDADDDNDLLSDSYERSISKLLDTCKADTDGDGVEDGYEYQSAKDLNEDEYQRPNGATPYPRKLPFPNPLDGTDANTDHDGDTLSLSQEYALWKYTVSHGSARTLTPLTYSAGKQYSLGKKPAANYDKQLQFLAWAQRAGRAHVALANLGTTGYPNAVPDWLNATWTMYDIRDFDRSGDAVDEQHYYDYNQNGYLDDAERDEDADGLPNQWEASGCLTRAYWDGVYSNETPYYLGANEYGRLNLADPDSDGDGVLDGADDQDHDDVPNVMECSRSMAYGKVAGHYVQDDPADADIAPPGRPWKAWVNPFNPCLPHPGSRTCKTYVQVGSGGKKWAPFNPDEADKYYFIFN
jgi:hypothetical protein